MKGRCLSPTHTSYPWYGAKGIKLSPRWMRFENFREDMYAEYLAHVQEFGEKDTTIERINSRGGYSKENCRWATRREQYRNTSKLKMLTFNGKTQCLTDWANELGINVDALGTRLLKGWTVEKSMTYGK